MKIFKPTYRDKQNGKTKRSQKWYVAFTDNQHVRRRLPCFSNKAATERASIMLGELLSCGGSLSPVLQGWLEELPAALRGKLASWGLLSRCKWSASLGKPLGEHLGDYVGGLRADGRTERHIKQVESYVTKILEGCRLAAWTDVDGNAVKTFLSHGRGPTGYGEKAYNLRLSAFKSFCTWLIREGRAIGSNPMEHHGPIHQTEFRRKRRWISDDEVRRLLEATENGPEHHGMSGRERRLLYILALQTGLRANELKSLRVSAFDFTANPATVRIESADAKGRRSDDLILRPETAGEIRAMLDEKEPQEAAFHAPPSTHTAEMLRLDLKAAGVPYTDASGRDADFHSLRHTFITNLSRAGVHPSVAQKLARHSDIKMTMKYYTHVLRESEVDAIGRLSDISGLSPACQNGAQQRTSVDGGGRRNADTEPKTALSA